MDLYRTHCLYTHARHRVFCVIASTRIKAIIISFRILSQSLVIKIYHIDHVTHTHAHTCLYHVLQDAIFSTSTDYGVTIILLAR